MSFYGNFGATNDPDDGNSSFFNQTGIPSANTTSIESSVAAAAASATAAATSEAKRSCSVCVSGDRCLERISGKTCSRGCPSGGRDCRDKCCNK